MVIEIKEKLLRSSGKRILFRTCIVHGCHSTHRQIQRLAFLITYDLSWSPVVD